MYKTHRWKAAESKDKNPMHALPDVGFLREKQILGDKNAKPPTPAIIPISRSAWWSGIKEGRYPPPVKLAPNTNGWPVGVIRALIEELEGSV